MKGLSVSGGSIPQPSAFQIDWEINAGWTGNLQFSEAPPLDLSADATITITIEDTAGPPGSTQSLTTPPLYVRQRRVRHDSSGISGSYELLDETSYRLSSGTKNFDTFLDTTSASIVSAVAAEFGVTISGHAAFAIWKEDVKQSTGWEPLRRLAAVAGEQLIIESSGSLRFVNNAWRAGSPSIPFEPSAVELSYQPQDRFGAIYVEKNMGMGTATGDQYYDFTTPGFVPSESLTTPLTVNNVQELSTAGRVTWVTFFDAQGAVCGQWRLGGDDSVVSDPIVGTWPAVSFSCIVEPDPETGETKGRIRLVGVPPNPPPSGIDPAIATTYGTGRGYPQPFSETLIPSESFASSHWQDWLQEINRGTHQITGIADFLHAGVRIGQSFSALGESGRIEKISWSGNTTGVSTTAVAEVL